MDINFKMKKVTFIVLISLGTFISCNKNFLNENDPISIGGKIFEGFAKSDSSIIWYLYDFNSESKYLKAFREGNTMPEINFILKSGGKSKLVKIDTVVFPEKPHIEVTFIKNLNFYKILAGYYIDSIENKIKIDSYTIIDLTKYCIEYFDSPYLPIGKVVWENFSFKLGSDNLHFKLGELDIINNTDSDIDMVRFIFLAFFQLDGVKGSGVRG